MYKITPSGVSILLMVSKGPISQSRICEALQKSQPYTSASTNRLVEAGILEKHRHGSRVVYELSDRTFNNSLKRFLFSNLQHQKLLANSALPLLTALSLPATSPVYTGYDIGMTASQLLHYSGLSRESLYRTLRKLQDAGAVYHRNKRYFASDGLPGLFEFISQFNEYHGTREIYRLMENMGQNLGEDLLPSSTIKLFQAGSEIVFSIHEGIRLLENEGIKPTGLTYFTKEGLDFQTSRDYYHYSMAGRDIRIEDIAIDQFMLEPKSIRNIAYTMLFLQHKRNEIDWKYLLNTSGLFSCETNFKTMIEYLENFADPKFEISKPLPSREEFYSLCSLYDVKI